LAVFFGITAIFWPGLTLVTLVYLFSAFVLAWGLTEVVHGLLSTERRDTWWMTLLFGLVGLGVGVYLVRHPHVSFTTFIVLLGLTLVARGILDVVEAFLNSGDDARRTLLTVGGIAAVVAGVVLLKQPESSGVAFVWVLGLYALVFGTLSAVVSYEARGRWLHR
jgi:uncharacterized membrane protein HdeD (DUF308 family)